MSVCQWTDYFNHLLFNSSCPAWQTEFLGHYFSWWEAPVDGRCWSRRSKALQRETWSVSACSVCFFFSFFVLFLWREEGVGEELACICLCILFSSYLIPSCFYLIPFAWFPIVLNNFRYILVHYYIVADITPAPISCFKDITLPHCHGLTTSLQKQSIIKKQLINLESSVSTGKSQTSAQPYWPRYRLVNMARTQFEIFSFTKNSL